MAAKWFYRRAGAESETEHGPFSSGKIRRMVARGELEPTDLLWKLGMEEWRPAGDSAKLFGGDDPRAARRRRRERARAPARQTVGKTPPAAAPPAWVGKRPLLVSIGIGTAAGVVISALIVGIILWFGGLASEEDDLDAPAPAVAVVARPAKPADVKPAAAAPPAAAEPAPAEAAGAEKVAVATAAPAADQPQADPPAEPQDGDPQPELPADLQAEAPRKPPARIRVRLPGEDF